jgi:uncharacterized protein (DUF4415 family)
MKLSREERQRQLDRMAAMPDEAIDTSDIPELTEEEFRRGVRGMLYRPIKRPVTMRLDADVIQWLKQDGPGYQTKANAILRTAMMHSPVSKQAAKASGERLKAASAKNKRLRRAS